LLLHTLLQLALWLGQRRLWPRRLRRSNDHRLRPVRLLNLRSLLTRPRYGPRDAVGALTLHSTVFEA